MAMAAKAGTLTAEFHFIAKSDVDDAAFAAVHRIEPERFSCTFHLLSGGIRAQAKFGDAQHSKIVRVERKTGMVVVRNPKSLHRHVLQSK